MKAVQVRPKMFGAASEKWSGAGSNRRHSDFQSDALPTELPDHRVSVKC